MRRVLVVVCVAAAAYALGRYTRERQPVVKIERDDALAEKVTRLEARIDALEHQRPTMAPVYANAPTTSPSINEGQFQVMFELALARHDEQLRADAFERTFAKNMSELHATPSQTARLHTLCETWRRAHAELVEGLPLSDWTAEIDAQLEATNRALETAGAEVLGADFSQYNCI